MSSISPHYIFLFISAKFHTIIISVVYNTVIEREIQEMGAWKAVNIFEKICYYGIHHCRHDICSSYLLQQ